MEKKSKDAKMKKTITVIICAILAIISAIGVCHYIRYENVDYEKLYYDYINEVITPKIGYCESQEEIFTDIQESKLYFEMKDIKGIMSAFIKDLNNDGIPEMITVSSFGKSSAKNTEFYEDSIVVEIHCYTIENNAVSDKGTVKQIATFKNGDERICVYLLDEKSPRLCIGSNYWPSNISSTSFSDQSFSSYVYTDEMKEEYTIVRYISHGTSAYVINDTDYGFDEGNEKCSSIFSEIGLDDSYVDNSWNEFPNSKIEKICLCGTEYNEKREYKAFVTDYTMLIKRI